MIVSRFPILESREVKYKVGCNLDSLGSKGCIYCKVQVKENEILHVFNTHMQATYLNQGEEVISFNVEARATHIK